ncbi:MAG: hypothetical protein PHP42_04610 [Bacteroidota bacterium]|nr:hypothetical protein [Bacteroidota bacterium]
MKMMISCTKATELIEKKLSFGLTPGELLRLHLHTQICSACRYYQKQSIFIEKVIAHQFSPSAKLPQADDQEVEQLSKKILEK